MRSGGRKTCFSRSTATVVLALALCWPAANTTAESYRYDRAGRLTQVSYPSGEVVRYTYDDNSNILSVQVLGDDLFSNGFEQ